eukprot:gnl/TRDRNA2_/TRDRNA2_174150_c0_seq1.p1 gnl/TRDRNA2_/TRDRNA2_174150_c0~~gnl/TRDRNA2_/TRDRNA2_174150_c0_seq1.p1  ORF type:complete len:434 (+),score=30.80 gnl/TRDRNA2_/TRDRNA2_174150_c0_seq1:56-1357(+)
MIYYQIGSTGCVLLTSVSAVLAFIQQPMFMSSFVVAVGCGFLGVFFYVTDSELYLGWQYLAETLPDHNLYASLAGLLAFLLIFRTTEALGRYNRGCQLLFQMQGDFFDATCLLTSLSRAANTDEHLKDRFRQVLVRLASILNLCCLCELSEVEIPKLQDFSGHIMDLEGIDHATIDDINNAQSKADCCFLKVQHLIVDNIHTALAVPPPLLVRCLSEFGTGVLRFHSALELIEIPFPFGYCALTELILALFSAVAPMFVAHMTRGPISAGFMSGLQVFFLWSLYGLALELDCPFGVSCNNIDVNERQDDLNRRLLPLLQLAKKPTADVKSPAVCNRAMAQLFKCVEGHETAKSHRVKGVTRRHTLLGQRMKNALFRMRTTQRLGGDGGNASFMSDASGNASGELDNSFSIAPTGEPEKAEEVQEEHLPGSVAR